MRILVAYDGTPQADAAVKFVADHHSTESITLMTVLDPLDGFLDAFGHGMGQYEQWHDDAKADAEAALAEAREQFDADADVTIETAVGQTMRKIVAIAEEDTYDLIVVGSHGRTGVSRVLLGSVAEEIVRRSPVPVTVVR